MIHGELRGPKRSRTRRRAVAATLLLALLPCEVVAQRATRAAISPLQPPGIRHLVALRSSSSPAAVRRRCLLLRTLAGVAVGGVAGYAIGYATRSESLGDIVYLPLTTLLGATIGGSVSYRIGTWHCDMPPEDGMTARFILARGPANRIPRRVAPRVTEGVHLLRSPYGSGAPSP